MAKKKKSLKLKMIIVILLISVGGVAAYAAMVLGTFYNDKKKYVYNSSEVVARTLATQVRWEIESIRRDLHPIEESIDKERFLFTPISNDLFVKQERMEHVFIYLPTTGKSFQEMDHIYLPKRSVKEFAPGGEVLEVLLKQAMDKGIAIQEVKPNKRFFVVVNKHKSKSSQRNYLTLAVFQSASLYESFVTPTVYKNFLLSKNSFLSMEPKYRFNKNNQFDIGGIEFFKPILSSRLPTGVAEINNFSGQKMFVSHAKVGVSDLLVVAVAESNSVMAVIEETTIKSILFLISMFSLSIFIGIMSTNGVVSSLKLLCSKVNLMSTGIHRGKLPVTSGDEIGELTDSVNRLAESLEKK